MTRNKCSGCNKDLKSIYQTIVFARFGAKLYFCSEECCIKHCQDIIGIEKGQN